MVPLSPNSNTSGAPQTGAREDEIAMNTTMTKGVRTFGRGVLTAMIAGGAMVVGAMHGGIPKAQAACGTINVGSANVYATNGYGNIDGQINMWHNTCRNTVWGSVNNWDIPWTAGFGDLTANVTDPNQSQSSPGYNFPELACYNGHQYFVAAQSQANSQEANSVQWTAGC